MIIKISDIKEIGDLPTNDVSRALKQKNNDGLIGIINCVVKKCDKSETRLWSVASKALAELQLRKVKESTLKELKKTIEDKTGTRCPVSHYALETAGIKKGDKILRPYPRSPIAKKLIEQWQKSSSKSFDSFYQKKVSNQDKAILETSKVHYLSREEREKYKVTFKNGKILINNKTPKNGAYIFALDAKGKTLLSGQKVKGVFQHTSFFAGRPVQSSGEWHVNNGRLSKVSLSSGHYMPTAEKDGKRLQKFLENDSNLGAKSAKKLSILAHA